MIKCPMMQVPIPDTILIEGSSIRRLRTDTHSGNVIRETIHYTLQGPRDAFVESCIDSFVVGSRPMGMLPHLADIRGRHVAGTSGVG